MTTSLRNCLKQFAKAISPHDAEQIRGRMAQFGGDEIRATEDYLAELRDERVEMFGATLAQSDIGLVSSIEKAVEEMNLPEWQRKPSKGPPRTDIFTDEMAERMESLRLKVVDQLNENDALRNRKNLEVFPDAEPVAAMRARKVLDESDGNKERAWQRATQLWNPEDATNEGKVLLNEIKKLIDTADDYQALVDIGTMPEQIEMNELSDLRNQQSKINNPVAEAKGSVIWAKLKNVGKKVERDFLGIEEFLTVDPNAKFTRAQVAEFVRENGITVEQTMTDDFDGDESIEDIDWSDGDPDTDSANWTYRTEDDLYEYDRGGETFGFELEEWLNNNLEEDFLEELEIRPLIGEDIEITGPDLLGAFSLDIYEDKTLVSREAFDTRELAQAASNVFATEENLFVHAGRVVAFEQLIDGEVEGVDDFDKKLRAAARDDFEAFADESNEESYMEDPQRRWTANNAEGVEIYGNDDSGYRVFVNGTVTSEEIYSLNEAQLQALNDAIEAGVVEGEGRGGGPQWGNYVAPGEHDNYREQKIRLPDIEADFYQTVHFAERNIVAFNRLTDRPGRELRIEESQSDWESAARRAGGYATGRAGDISTELERIEQLVQRQFDAVFDEDFLYNYAGGARVTRGENLEKVIFYNVAWELVRNNNEMPANVFNLGGEQLALYEKVQADLVPLMNQDIKSLVDEYDKVDKQLGAERAGIPGQPYRGNDWTNLALKYALAEAIEHGYDTLAWNDNATIQGTWSQSYSYEAQYDKKMPSMIKKLTGQTARHVQLDGSPMPAAPDTSKWTFERNERRDINQDQYTFELRDESGELVESTRVNVATLSDEQIENIKVQAVKRGMRLPMGKWVIDITPDMTVEGLPLLQQDRGEIQLLDNERIIKLGAASDVSTFLHEAGHLFLEVEKQLAVEFGLTAEQQTILDWLGATSFDQVVATTPEGIAMHEQFARGFEAYLMEGVAPSLKLRDAFAAFKAWLTRVYESLLSLNVELSPEIRDVFDRLLATEAEIMEASSNEAYDELFRTQEQSGMTDVQWVEYQDNRKKVAIRAAETVDEKLMKEYTARRTKEWKEERAPLVEEEFDRLSKTPAYQLIGDLNTTPMDFDLVMQAVPEERRKVVQGKLISKAVKEGGKNPAEYADQYGYDSVALMIEEITTIPTLKAASEAAGQARMIEMHGDILNDGSLEIEVQEALHNDVKAEVLLAELKALKPKRGPAINREYLKAEARRIIGSMTFSQINPNKYYRAEIRAAKRSTNPDEAYDAKIQQLANHYLYREAVDVKAKMLRWQKNVKGVQTRNYNVKQVDENYVANLRALSTVYDMGSNPEAQHRRLEGLLSWFSDQVATGNVELMLMDPNLVIAMEAKRRGELDRFVLPTFDSLTAQELSGLDQMLKHLRFVGGQVAEIQTDEIKAKIRGFTNSVNENGGRDLRKPEFAQQKESWTDSWVALGNKLPNLRNLLRKLDDDWKGEGVAQKTIFRVVEDANNKKLILMRELRQTFKEELSDIHKIGLTGLGLTGDYRRKHDIPVSNDVTIVKEDGQNATFNPEEMFMLALYWGEESGREAIREGYQLTDADALRVMENLTDDQLRTVNSVWAITETLWPRLSSAAIKRWGSSPEKIDAAPFEINGIIMTGGHQELFYNNMAIELRSIQQEGEQYATMQVGKTGSLHERVGSGGKPVLLDRNNIVRSLEENAHFIAFSEAGQEIRRIMNAPDVQEAITRKHGTPFHFALIQQIDQLVRDVPAKETKELAAIFRTVRRAATYRHLLGSIRNIMQQFTSLIIASKEVGPVNLASAMARLMSDGGASMKFVDESSPSMRDRGSFVNREAADELRSIMATGKIDAVYQWFARVGFTPQTFVDMGIAYPTWIARYEQEYNEHADHDQARSAGDEAVARAVGTGADLHMGNAFNSNQAELTRMMTIFGSWFNTTTFQRMYGATKGFSDFKSTAALTEILFLPFMVALFSAVIVMDMPEDDDEEGWGEWMASRYFAFLSGTIPILRDIVAMATSGFAPKTVISGAQESPVRVIKEIEAFIEDKQSALKTGSDVLKAVSTVVPIPAAGQATRLADYYDSYAKGNEGDFDPYQSLVEGKQRNK